MTESPVSDSQILDNGSIVEAPESERLAKLSGENARLRSEVRQALTRAQRAEADAKRVRASTKFAVGDLLVKAARHPRRLIVLPRDLVRLYRLRRHRRREVEPTDESISAMRARRSDLTDEVAARLLLPRLGERPLAAFSIAGALEPLTAAQWSPPAAVTSVLPHDAATLMAEADPDVAVIDTGAGLPLGTWSHLGNPAAADRAFAAHALISAAKGHGRPVVLLRGLGDNPGFDALASRCDLVVDLPHRSTTRTPHPAWNPGIDLGLAHRVDGPRADSHRPSRIASGAYIEARPGLDDPTILASWESELRAQGLTLVEMSARAPIGSAFEQALRDSQVVAVHARADGRPHGVGLMSLAALLTGRTLVAPDDAELRRILGLGPDDDAAPFGWMAYPAGDATAATHALAGAVHTPDVDAATRWRVWRALFDHASAVSAWTDMVARLGLGCRPGSVRDTALMLRGEDISAVPDAGESIGSLGDILAGQSHLPREIVCDPDHVDSWRAIIGSRGLDGIRIIAVRPGADPTTDRSRVAQAISSALLVETSTGAMRSFGSVALQDAVLAHELSDRSPVEIVPATGSGTIMVTSRSEALLPTCRPTVRVDHPGWSR